MRLIASARLTRGLSIVELMVGVAVGLFIVAGATKLFVDNLVNNRRMLVETRVNQDLRAAADLVARDLRRASYWRNSHLVISLDPLVAPTVNPHRVVNTVSATEVNYSYAKDDNNVLDAAETFGVRRAVVSVGGVDRGVLQLQTVSGGWQDITDPATLDFPANGLVITPLARTAELWDACPCLGELTCKDNQFKNPDPVTAAKGIYFDNRPRLDIRQLSLLLRGNSVTTPAFSREVSETIRVRNDEVIGTCPTP